MNELTASIGRLRFRLARVEHPATPPSFASKPFLMLDGTEIGLWSDGRRKYLLVDHRGTEAGAARVEFWECLSSPEGELDGLYAVANATV